ncbi:bile acid:sodium symporter, partial [Streptomyces sp. TRM76130]|nr:bile acid:sodium symporter [Streptomyces sp. TRM76130]
REALDGLQHWRLHVTVLACTFAVFPVLGLAARGFVPVLLTEPLYQGLLFCTLVPSTVQSSIAFTSVARGNVPAAICAGSFSSL